VWHSIVGSFWSVERAKVLDFWSLIIFSAFFIIIHLSFLVWLFFAHAQIRKLKVKERDYLRSLKELQNCHDSMVKKLPKN
jgi:hypothetical protein